jgi:hypothetical protein
MTDNRDTDSRKWLDDAEEALNLASESVKKAWEGTKETRMSALEAAREAATQLGRAIDQGIDVARDTWGAAKAKETAEGSPGVSQPASPAPAPPVTGDEGAGTSGEEE